MLVSLRFGYLLYLALVIAATTAVVVVREGSESARRATELRRGSPEGASERKRERRGTGGLIRGWRRRRRCWSWRWVVMALAVRDANRRLPGVFGSHTPDDVTLRRYQDTRDRKTKKTRNIVAEQYLDLRADQSRLKVTTFYISTTPM